MSDAYRDLPDFRPHTPPQTPEQRAARENGDQRHEQLTHRVFPALIALIGVAAVIAILTA